MSTIKLECKNCGKSVAYDRSADPSIRSDVVKIVQPHCDECWNGAREGETWYGADGQEIQWYFYG